MYDKRLQLKLKIKNLETEARYIKKEIDKNKGCGYHLWGPLSRLCRIKTELRSNLIAYGFIRGVPYDKIENCPRTDPYWGDIYRTALEYGHKCLPHKEDYYSSKRPLYQGKARIYNETITHRFHLWSGLDNSYMAYLVGLNQQLLTEIKNKNFNSY